MDQVVQQALSRGVGNYIHEGMERASAGMSRRAVESWPQLLDYVQRTPDEVWHLLTAGVEGAAQVFLARVTNPTLRSILAAVLAILPGLGRGFADADARRAVLNGLRANVTDTTAAVHVVGGQPRPMDRFFHTSNLPGLAHRATYDAAGNPTGTTCQLVAHDRRAHRALNPDRQQGGQRGQQAQVNPGAPYPEDYPTLDAAGQMRLGLCGACFEGGSLATTAAAPATTLFGKLNPDQRVRLLRVLMWIRRTEDATDDSIVSDLASADIEAVRTALGEGFAADNQPTEESINAILAAAGRRPSAASRIENMFRRAVRAFDRGDWSGFRAAFNRLGVLGLVLLFFFVLWGAAALVAVGTFFQGWVTGNSWSWMYGGIWVFIASLFIPLVQKPIVWVGDEISKLRGNPGLTNESFALIGLDVAAFCLILGAIGAWGIEMGFGPAWRGALAFMVMLLIGALFQARRYLKDMSLSRYGVDVIAKRQKFADFIFDSAYRRVVLVATAAILAPLSYVTVGRSIDIPWVPLRAVEYDPQVEVQTAEGPVTVQYAVVTPNPFGLRTQHDAEELFGNGAIDTKMVRLLSDGKVESDSLVPDLPGFILRRNGEGETLTFSWKPGLTAQTFDSLGWDWYARHCYPEVEAQGSSSNASSGGTQGAAASANAQEREYLGLSAGWAAALLAGIGLALLIPAGLVRGQGAGAGAVRFVGTLAFLAFVVGALGILGVEGCQGAKDGWVEAHTSEARAAETRPASAPSSPPRRESEVRKASSDEDASPAPLSRVRTTEECKALSPVGRDICLANIRKASANRTP